MKEKLQKIRENAIAQTQRCACRRSWKERGTHRRIKEYERGCTGGSPEGGTVGK